MRLFVFFPLLLLLLQSNQGVNENVKLRWFETTMAFLLPHCNDRRVATQRWPMGQLWLHIDTDLEISIEILISSLTKVTVTLQTIPPSPFRSWEIQNYDKIHNIFL